MSGVSLPVPLVLLLRRIFTAISTLSLSSAHSLAVRLIQSGENGGTQVLKAGETINGAAPADFGFGWSSLRGALGALRWPWVVYLEQMEQGGDGKGQFEGALGNMRKDASKASYRGVPEPSSSPSEDPEKPPPPPRSPLPETPLYRLLYYPTLFDPIRTPRYPIALCHGLYGFDVRGPSSFPALQLHYWANVLKILRGTVGAEVICPGVPGTGSIESRAQKMDAFLKEKAAGKEINFIAHSMGGLDCRHLISHLKPEEYRPLSLMSVATPHRGSAFMDWCTANIGLGSPPVIPITPDELPSTPPPLPFSLKSPLLSRPPTPLSLTLSALPTSLTSLLLSLLDSPAYANLSTAYLNRSFNPSTPDVPSVRYFSVAARTGPLSVLHPLWLPKLIMDGTAELEGDTEGNDGLVSVKSARWGEYLGVVEECDHWEMRGARGFVRSWEQNQKGKASEGATAVEEKKKETEFVQAANTVNDQMRSEAAARKVDREEKGAVDRLSAVIEWMTENVSLGLGSGSGPKDKDKLNVRASDKGRKGKRLPPFELERFYIALSRKLYDEGL